jgi:hypothetical protein
MDPVDPRRESRFWKDEPSRDFWRVSFNEASLFTGAEASIHPSPVPALPDTTFRFVFDEDDDDDGAGANPDTVGAAERTSARAIEKFIFAKFESCLTIVALDRVFGSKSVVIESRRNRFVDDGPTEEQYLKEANRSNGEGQGKTYGSTRNLPRGVLRINSTTEISAGEKRGCL